MKHPTVTATFAAVIFAAGATSLAQPAEAVASVVCKKMTWGYSKRPIRAMAKLMAVNNWRTKAGPTWNTWALAKARTRACRKEGKLWNCVAKAQPCRKLGIKN